MTFDEFAAAELPALARYARVLTGDRQRAHDVLADALITTQLRWKRIGAMDRPAAYVRRVVTTTYLGDRRRWASRHIALTVTGQPPDAPGPDPATAVDNRDQLQGLLAALPRQQRAAIVLRYYLGLADAEIADELGCAPGTVRSYISRGLATMRISGDSPNDPAVPRGSGGPGPSGLDEPSEPGEPSGPGGPSGPSGPSEPGEPASRVGAGADSPVRSRLGPEAIRGAGSKEST